MCCACKTEFPLFDVTNHSQFPWFSQCNAPPHPLLIFNANILCMQPLISPVYSFAFLDYQDLGKPPPPIPRTSSACLFSHFFLVFFRPLPALQTNPVPCRPPTDNQIAGELVVLHHPAHVGSYFVSQLQTATIDEESASQSSSDIEMDNVIDVVDQKRPKLGWFGSWRRGQHSEPRIGLLVLCFSTRLRSNSASAVPPDLNPSPTQHQRTPNWEALRRGWSYASELGRSAATASKLLEFLQCSRNNFEVHRRRNPEPGLSRGRVSTVDSEGGVLLEVAVRHHHWWCGGWFSCRPHLSSLPFFADNGIKGPLVALPWWGDDVLGPSRLPKWIYLTQS